MAQDGESTLRLKVQAETAAVQAQTRALQEYVAAVNAATEAAQRHNSARTGGGGGGPGAPSPETPEGVTPAPNQGGGGGGGGNSGKTTETAVRVIHASIDLEPVDLRIETQLPEDPALQRAKFGDVTSYVPIKSQGHVFSFLRANTGAPVFSLNGTLEEETEYTLLLSGKNIDDTFKVSLIPEPVVEPEPGFARLQLINALVGSAPMIAVVGSVSTPQAPFSLASGYVDVPSGLQQSVLVRTTTGRGVSSVLVDFADRGEITVVVGGDNSLGVVTTRLFADLD